MQERWLLGTPDEIAKKIIAWQPRLGVDHLIFTPRPPGMPLRQAVDEIEAIAKGVMPALAAACRSLEDSLSDAIAMIACSDPASQRLASGGSFDVATA